MNEEGDGFFEKYMQLAEVIAQKVPREPRSAIVREIPGSVFVPQTGDKKQRYGFRDAVTLSHAISLADHEAGTHAVEWAIDVGGPFDFDAGRAQLKVRFDGAEVHGDELSWQAGKTRRLRTEQVLSAGTHRLELQLVPTVPSQPDRASKTGNSLKLASVGVRGPLEPERWAPTPNYARNRRPHRAGRKTGRSAGSRCEDARRGSGFL